MEQMVARKWEYHVEEFENTRDISGMNESLSRLGAQGWELVSISGGSTADGSGTTKTLRRKNDPYRAFFKRPES